LNDPNNFSYIRLNRKKVLLGKYNYIIDGVTYLSTQEVIVNNLAKNDSQVRERCRSKNLKWKNWKLVLKNRSNDYPDRE
jgi:hypothetical protein